MSVTEPPSGFVSTYDRDAPRPELGSRWTWARNQPAWSPLNPGGAREDDVVVTEVKWNGEEWWVQTRGPRGEFWTDVNVFWEGVR